MARSSGGWTESPTKSLDPKIFARPLGSLASQGLELPWPPPRTPEMRLPADRGFSQISIIHNIVNKYVFTKKIFATFLHILWTINFIISLCGSAISDMIKPLMEPRWSRDGKIERGGSYNIGITSINGTLTTEGGGGREWRVHWPLLLQGVGVVTTSGEWSESGDRERERGKLAKVAHYSV